MKLIFTLLLISTTCLSQTFNDTLEIKITDALGKTQTYIINTPTWRNGVYFITVPLGLGNKVIKLIKETPKKEESIEYIEYIELNQNSY